MKIFHYISIQEQQLSWLQIKWRIYMKFIVREKNGNQEIFNFFNENSELIGTFIENKNIVKRGMGSSYDKHRHAKGDHFESNSEFELTNGLTKDMLNSVLAKLSDRQTFGDNDDEGVSVTLRSIARNVNWAVNKKEAAKIEKKRALEELRIFG